MIDSTVGRSPEQLAQQFRIYARDVYPGASPLYKEFSRQIAEDPELLALADHAPKGQPTPNLLFGVVHFLLLQGIDTPLAAYYPSLSAEPLPSTDSYALFRHFCLEHEQAIQEIMGTHRVQTNEVTRCACLLPVFGLVARLGAGQPLSLVEIGPSAGLNLLWDRYGYDYAENRRCGMLDSPVQLQCELRGPFLPPIPQTLPAIAYRLGIDLHPIDVRDKEAVLWLRALVWPEQKKRALVLQRAIEIARHEPPPLVAGDAVSILPDDLGGVPADTTLCLYHSFALNQVAPHARERLWSTLSEASQARPVYLISLEWPRGGRTPTLDLTVWEQGERSDYALAFCDQHGAWLEWRDVELSKRLERS